MYQCSIQGLILAHLFWTIVLYREFTLKATTRLVEARKGKVCNILCIVLKQNCQERANMILFDHLILIR